MTAVSRRTLLTSAAVAAGIACTALADDAPEPFQRRKFTVCLAPGTVGVRDDPEHAIDRATRFGFEAIEPSPSYIAKLSDAHLQDYLGKMREAKLAWGCAGLPVQFRGDDAAFERDVKALPTARRHCSAPAPRAWAPGSPPPPRR